MYSESYRPAQFTSTDISQPVLLTVHCPKSIAHRPHPVFSNMLTSHNTNIAVNSSDKARTAKPWPGGRVWFSQSYRNDLLSECHAFDNSIFAHVDIHPFGCYSSRLSKQFSNPNIPIFVMIQSYHATGRDDSMFCRQIVRRKVLEIDKQFAGGSSIADRYIEQEFSLRGMERLKNEVSKTHCFVCFIGQFLPCQLGQPLRLRILVGLRAEGRHDEWHIGLSLLVQEYRSVIELSSQIYGEALSLKWRLRSSST